MRSYHSFLFLLLLWAGSTKAQRHLDQFVSNTRNGKITLLEGNLGSLTIEGGRSLQDLDDESVFQKAAKQALETLLGNVEKVNPTKLHRDKTGHADVRFDVEFKGSKVEGATLMMHVDDQGNIFAINGEFIDPDAIDDRVLMGCKHAMKVALSQTEITDFEWKGKCELALVYGFDSNVYKAWKRTAAYAKPDNTPAVDIIYASAQTGDFVAINPTIYGGLSLTTYDCRQGTSTCYFKADSTSPINTADWVVNNAHNNAIKVYDYYKIMQGRDGYDGNGAGLQVFVHYGSRYNNAYWSSGQMVFGDGDGTTFAPLVDLDIVGHEFTHGVTSKESNLVYSRESGAMNEAMSDIFGAVIERYYGSIVSNAWKIGEVSFTPNTAGDALRVMNDPVRQGDYDYYPTRYTGTDDNGGVHWNSGIMNLAFVLMVQGGSHPRGKSPTIGVVGALNPDFDTSMEIAADIFYQANANCLTSSSGFSGAMSCTGLKAPRKYRGTVYAAWEAVGVPLSSIKTLANGTPYSGIAGALNSDQWFVLDAYRLQKIRCDVSVASGAVEMSVRLASTPGGTNECSLTTSATNSCTTKQFFDRTRGYVSLFGATEYSGASLTCTLVPPLITELSNAVPLVGQNASTGTYTVYRLPGVPSGNSVRCSLSGDGDASMSVAFQSYSNVDECTSKTSGTSTESCTTGANPSTSTTNAFLIVKAEQGYSSLTVTCNPIAPVCSTASRPCATKSNCCSPLTCDLSVCKACRAVKQTCTQHTQCCSGSCNTSKRKCR